MVSTYNLKIAQVVSEIKDDTCLFVRASKYETEDKSNIFRVSIANPKSIIEIKENIKDLSDCQKTFEGYQEKYFGYIKKNFHVDQFL